MACYAYSVLTRWFSSVYCRAGSETALSKQSKQAMPEYTAASGRLDYATFQELPTRHSYARDFEPSFYTPIDRQGSGLVANDL